MPLIWKYKIALSDDKCFDKYEEEYKISFPEELRKFIMENNAASPNKTCVKIGDNERVFDAVLSFNEEEDEATTFCDVYKFFEKKDVIPFAADPFGNYYYYSIDSNKIGYYEHEEGKYLLTEYSLNEFLEAIYS